MANVLGLVTIVSGLINNAHFWFNGRGFSLRDGLSPFKILALELKHFESLWQMIEIHIDGHYINLQPELVEDLAEIRKDVATVFQNVQGSVQDARATDLQLLQNIHNGPLFVFQDPQNILTQREEHWRGMFKEHRIIRQRQLLNYCTTSLNAILQVAKYVLKTLSIESFADQPVGSFAVDPSKPSKQSSAAMATNKFNDLRQRLAVVEKTRSPTIQLQINASANWLHRTTSFSNASSTANQVQDLAQAWIAPGSNHNRVVSVLQGQIRRLQHQHVTVLEENEVLVQQNEAAVQRNEDLVARGFEWKNRSDRHEANAATLNYQVQELQISNATIEYTHRETLLQYQREQAPLLNQLSQLEKSNAVWQEQVGDLQHALTALQERFDTLREAQAQDQHRESRLFDRRRDLEADNAARLRENVNLEQENTILQTRVEELEAAINRFTTTQVANLEATIAETDAAQEMRQRSRRNRSHTRDPSTRPEYDSTQGFRADAQNELLQAQLRDLQATVEQQGKDHAVQLAWLREELQRERTRRQNLEERSKREKHSRRNRRSERRRTEVRVTRPVERVADRRRRRTTTRKTGIAGFIDRIFFGA
jgi:hypothetical protein